VTELIEARRRVRAYIKAHEANPYQGEIVLGMVGMNGAPLLRLADLKTLTAPRSERTNTP
jgi:hypothetical protein